MKKLLGFLGTITITGSGITGIVANKPYSVQQKEIKLLNSEINYLQENNNLKRNKRDNNNLFSVNENNGLKINNNDRNSFKESHNKFFRSLIQANILNVLFNNEDQPGTSSSENNEIVILNKKTNYNGFIVPVIIEENSQSKRIKLVFRTRDLYLEGFIVNNNYYHFSSADIRFIDNFNAINLGISGDYRELFVNENGNGINININWNRIFTSFNTLSQIRNLFLDVNIRNSLGIIAVVIAENWRFRMINNLINEKIIKNNQYIVFGKGQQTKENLYQVAMNWSQQGASVLKQLSETIDFGPVQSLPYSHYFDENNQPRIDNALWGLPSWTQARRTWREWFNSFALPSIPINIITDQVYNYHTVRILFLIAVNNYIFNSCHQHGSDLRKRDINDNLNQKFCDLQSSVSKIKGDIISIQIFDENTKSGNRQAGDAYVGTTEGLYLIHNNTGNISVYRDLNFPIADIKIDKNEGIYILTKTGKVYFISNNDEGRPIQINSLNNKFVTSIGILENDSPVNSNLKAGIVYFGTTEGVYFSYERSKYQNAVSKIEGLNEEIAFVLVDNNGSAHVLTKTRKVYVVRYDSWNAIQIGTPKNKDEGCSLKKYVVNHITWKNLIPFYGLIHMFTCE